jgi:hypothetical protein
MSSVRKLDEFNLFIILVLIDADVIFSSICSCGLFCLFGSSG